MGDRPVSDLAIIAIAGFVRAVIWTRSVMRHQRNSTSHEMEGK